MADPVDTSLAFKLHSRPGAPRTILLDFTGHTATGTAWNTTGSIVTPPYDIDGIPSSFSQTELANIIAIWRGVAEDYSPFEVRAERGRKPDGREGAGAGARQRRLPAAARSRLQASPEPWPHSLNIERRTVPRMLRRPSLAPQSPGPALP